jgi:D-inositol-3-phosphate glycosyltransferase
VVQVEPGHRVVHIPAGPYDLPKEKLPTVLDEFGDAVVEHIKNESPADVLHANYWLSGLVAHRIKHELDMHFVSTFHSLARVKAEGATWKPNGARRAEAEFISVPTRSASAAEEHRQ